MKTKIIDCKKHSENIKSSLIQIVEKQKLNPSLLIISNPSDKAGDIYLKNKKKFCEEVGIKVENRFYRENETNSSFMDFVLDVIYYAKVKKITGIIFQLPIPYGLSADIIKKNINLDLDVDGANFTTAGMLNLNLVPGYVSLPCTPLGIMELIKLEKIETEGKKAVVVGRSSIVGRPMESMLLNKNCTVTTCHSKTPKDLFLKEIAEADIIVSAAGAPHLINGSMIKKGSVIFDVGITKIDKHLIGDCDYRSCLEIASKITPVPGGIGPMTVAMLARNTIQKSFFQKKEYFYHFDHIF